ncbi:MAG: Tn3 family transposase [Pseudonocardiales bacterium]|nr:MAG: Tn3 family transposase [Pseudonocardiales bacterium]
MTDEQAAAYGRFVDAPSRADLDRLCFLDDDDRTLIAGRRGDASRLGFALQLVTVRSLGLFLPDPLDVPISVLDYVAGQLQIADPSCVKSYVERRSTRFEHAIEVAQARGYRDFASAEAELRRWVSDLAWTTGDGPRAIFDAAVVWLRTRMVLLPGVSRLARLVATERDAATKRVWQSLSGLLSSEQAETLDGLLLVPASSRVSVLEELRTGPRTVSGLGMVKALHRVSELVGLGVGGLDLAGVPARRVVDLARYGMAAKAPALARHDDPRRRATLLATARRLQVRAVDDALDLFEVLMSTQLLAHAEQESGKDKLRRYPRISRDAGRLAAAVGVLLEASEWGGPVSLERVWEAIEDVVTRSELRTAVEHIVEVAPPPDADPDGEWRQRLVTRYPSVRGFVPLLCQVIDFDATAEATEVLAALQALPDLLQTRPSVRVPAGFLDARRVEVEVVPPGWWQRLVFTEDRPAGTVDRAGYVFCVLEQFHKHLTRRNIFAATSSRWADPRAQLLTGTDWAVAKGPALHALQLSEDPSVLLTEEAGELDAAWRHTAAGAVRNEIAVDADGRLHAAALDAIADPASLTELRERLQAMLPRVDLPELILDVFSWQPGFLEAFRAASGGDSRLGDLSVTVTAALCAHALNIGFAPIIDDRSPALTRARISHVDQNYLRPDTYTAGNKILIEAQAGNDLAQAWGGGLVAAVDGMRFVVPVRSVDARPNPRYFGRRRGATWLNMISDQGVGLAGRVLSGTPRDSLHLIDLIYSQDGGTRPEVIITDTGSYSDIVFGLLRLLGFDYQPQLADLPDQKLWRTDPTADYGALNPAARGRIDLAKIAAHWPDMLRLAASIHTGTVTAHDALRVLAPGGTLTQLGQALAHFGRIFKTRHVLTFVDDETYRRGIKAMRNLSEGRHDLARHVFHGHTGELRHGYRDGMEDQLGALGLVLNCITLWNTIYLDHAITQLRADGHPINEADLARISPYMRKHINVHGHYSFTTRTGKTLRPLREVATDGLGEGQ